MLEVSREDLHHNRLLRAVIDAAIPGSLFVVLQGTLELVQLTLNLRRAFNLVLINEGDDSLKVGGVHGRVLRVEASGKPAPGFQAVLTLDQAHDPGGLLVTFRQRDQMVVDGLRVRNLDGGQAGEIQGLLLFGGSLQRLPHFIVVHAHPCHKALRPGAKRCGLLELLGVKALDVEHSSSAPPTDISPSAIRRLSSNCLLCHSQSSR